MEISWMNGKAQEDLRNGVIPTLPHAKEEQRPTQERGHAPRRGACSGLWSWEKNPGACVLGQGWGPV